MRLASSRYACGCASQQAGPWPCTPGTGHGRPARPAPAGRRAAARTRPGTGRSSAAPGLAGLPPGDRRAGFLAGLPDLEDEHHDVAVVLGVPGPERADLAA